MAKRVIPNQWVEPSTGRLTMDAIRYLNDLDNGGENSIGTLLAGVNTVTATTAGIIAGTVPIDPTITGRGSLSNELDSTGANLASVAVSASAGALAASVSPPYASGTDGGGIAITTNSVTVTASGGTAPYTYAWTKKFGDTIAPNSATSATTTFTSTPGVNQSDIAVYTCTVTDNVAATTTVDVSVSTLDITV